MMDNAYFQNHLQEELNKLNIKGFENINIGDMLHYVCHVNDPRLSVKNWVKIFYHYIRRILFFSNDFEIEDDAETLFLLSNAYYGRDDYVESMNKVSSCVNKKVRMYASRKFKPHFSFFKYLGYLPSWNSGLKRKVSSLWDRWFIMDHLFMILTSYKEYEMIEKKYDLDIKNLVVWCDVHSIDYYFVQKFNQLSKKTVTLQHGLMVSEGNSWTLSHSTSQYFLAHGQFTVQEANLAGGVGGEILPVGIPSKVCEKNTHIPEDFSTDILGILLDGDELYDDNVLFLRFMQEYCKKYNKIAYIKLHPSCRMERYESLIDSNVVKGLYINDISLQEFSDKIDIAIIKASTCLIEMLGLYKPTFIYNEKGLKRYVFSNFHELKFENEDELTIFLEMVKDKDYINEIKRYQEYFGSGENVTEKYIEAFRSLGIK